MAGEDELLALCYRNSLRLAVDYSMKAIAFPAISTGAYRFPMERACKIALSELRNFSETNTILELAILVCFDIPTYECYLRLLDSIL